LLYNYSKYVHVGIWEEIICKICTVLVCSVLLVSCAAAQYLYAPAHTELLPRSWNLSVFIVNVLIMHITEITFKVPRSRQVV
jgi:hypothetical protein